MKVVAKAVKGKEYLYNPRSARKVSARSAEYVCKVVNEYKFLLGSADNEVWHIYDIDEYDTAYDYAMRQSFTVRNGVVTARAY